MARLVEPPGARSCRDGGTWETCRGSQGSNFLVNDLQSLETRLPAHTLSLAKAEMRDKMSRATRGDLTYGRGPAADVERIAATHDVLELRLAARSGDSGTKLLLRLFFSEPVERPGVMCALMLYWKRPGPIDLSDQTEQAKLASRRLHEHLTRA